jgi:hypothetical protein
MSKEEQLLRQLKGKPMTSPAVAMPSTGEGRVSQEHTETDATPSHHLSRHLEGKHMTRSATQAAGVELAQLIDLAKNALPQNRFFSADGETSRFDKNRSGIAGRNGTISLRAYLPDLVDSDWRPYATPAPTAPAGEVHRLDTALLLNSRVMQAGARLIVMPSSMEPVSDKQNRFVGFRDEPAGFVTIEAASLDVLSLQTVNPPLAGGSQVWIPPEDRTEPSDNTQEATITAQAIPVHEAKVNRDGWTQRGLRFELKRSTMKAKGMPLLTAEMMTAIALGIARAADQELLSAITATNPAAYSLAAASAEGLRFGELRAIVGTGAAGAAVNDSGRLHVSGVPAELTPDMAGTLVGAWDRSALAINDEIQLLVERTNANGSMAVTCWVDMQPLLPEPGKFWSVV